MTVGGFDDDLGWGKLKKKKTREKASFYFACVGVWVCEKCVWCEREIEIENGVCVCV